ncbi:hypothetical protein [Profundibacter sp.]
MTKPAEQKTEALPQSGGSYVRAKDGSLQPNTDQPAGAVPKSAASKPAKKEA